MTNPVLDDPDFWKPRRCMREPIEDIFKAANLLSDAADAHLANDNINAEKLIREANLPSIRAWTESLWGSTKNNPNNYIYHRYRVVENAPAHLQKNLRVPLRMPSRADCSKIIERYGRNCVFCGIPLIRREVREFLRKLYPSTQIWGSRNVQQHAAFQCMWLQYDHLLPHSRGGDNTITNVVPTCAGCNYGRWDATLSEVGIIDPSINEISKTSWDGLERLLPPNRRI